MPVATLKENNQIQVSGNDLSHGKGIEEILYFPKVSESLENDAENNLQEVWVLEGKRFDAFITETKKYDEAAAKLAKAQESGNPEQIKVAQDEMRTTLAKGLGKKSDDSVDPVPQGAYKNLIECIGYVSKRTFYLSNFDLQKVKNEKGRSNFRFATNTMKTISDGLMQAIEAAATDSDDGTSDDRLKNEFWEIKAQIKKEWKLGEGQVKASKIKKFIPNPLIQEFILSDENCELVDSAIAYFNDTANFSKQQKEQKLQQVAGLLEKKDGEFGHYDWGKVLIGVQEIWNKTDPDFVAEIKDDFPDIPLEEAVRKALIKKLYEKKLPAVVWDASGGAQVMRYSANVGAEASFDLKDKINAKVSAEAKFSLLEAGAEANVYLPDSNGFDMSIDVPVRVEKLKPERIETNPYEDIEGMNFAFDSFFVLPSTIIATVKNLEALLSQQRFNSDKGLIVKIVGHTDATGSNAYNMKLGQLRAKATFEVFANNYAAWYGYLKETKKSKWTTVERDFMKLSLWLVTYDRFYFLENVVRMEVGDEDRMEDLLKKLYKPMVGSEFPHEKLETPSLHKIYNNSKPKEILDGPNISAPLGGLGAFGGGFPTSAEEIKISDKELVERYFRAMTSYAIESASGMKSSYLNLFYHDCVSLPYWSQGESQLKELTSGKSAVNRRVDLEAWSLKSDYTLEDQPLSFGYSRLKITGMVSCFVGATIGLSTQVDITTSKGMVQMAGKKNATDEVTKYEGDQVVPGDMGKNNVTAKAEAFAGAKAEAGLALALEWKSPDVTTDKPRADFSVLASVGGSVTGTAGAGIEGEFKIGFDQKTKTFQVKAKAQATWGIGGGGALCFTVGVTELWDFATLVYRKLQEHEFNFVDIFENEKDSNGDETESKVNVFEIYSSWVVEQFKQGKVLQAGVAAGAGLGAYGAFSLLESFDKLIEKWQENKHNKEELEMMIKELNRRPDMARYLPPEAKGRMLFMLIQYKEMSLRDIGKFDLHSKSEEAAVFLITQGIKHPRDWQETMEHMALKQGNKYTAYKRSPNKKYTTEEKALRAKNNVIYLRNELLDEPEDWSVVEQHLNNLGVQKELINK